MLIGRWTNRWIEFSISTRIYIFTNTRDTKCFATIKRTKYRRYIRFYLKVIDHRVIDNIIYSIYLSLLWFIVFYVNWNSSQFSYSVLFCILAANRDSVRHCLCYDARIIFFFCTQLVCVAAEFRKTVGSMSIRQHQMNVTGSRRLTAADKQPKTWIIKISNMDKRVMCSRWLCGYAAMRLFRNWLWDNHVKKVCDLFLQDNRQCSLILFASSSSFWYLECVRWFIWFWGFTD